MDTKTLDDRIREKARAELRNQIDGDAKKFYAWIGKSGQWPSIKVGPKDQQVSVGCSDAFRLITEAIFAAQAPNAEKAAVEQFLSKVDSLQEQVDELRDITGAA